MSAFRSSPAALLLAAFGAAVFTVSGLRQVDAAEHAAPATSSFAVQTQGDAFVARVGRRASQAITQARTALQAGDLARASDLARQAALALERIRSHLPAAQLRAQIQLLEREIRVADAGQITPRFAPIYSDLAQTREPLPVARVMHAIDNARRDFERGDRDAAAAALRQADRALIDTELDAPLTDARSALAEALGAMKGDRVDAAERALQRAAAALDVVTVNVESPARRARLSMWQATRDYAAGLLDDSRADLQRAAQALDSVADRGDAEARGRAAAVARDARQVADTIGQDSGEAVHGSQQAIDALWTRTVALAERAGIQTYLDAKKVETADPLKRQLIDARLHLSYARIDRTTLDEPQAAQHQLALALDDVNAAIARAPQPPPPSVQALHDELRALLGGLAVSTAAQIDADQLRYDLAASDLQQLEGLL